MPADLTDDDRATLAALLRDTIAADRFPLSPRVRGWKAILDKLEPPAPKARPAAAAEAAGRAEHGCCADARDEPAAAVRQTTGVTDNGR